MQYPRICLCAMLVCLFSCFGTVMGQDTIDLKSLADSVRKANGKPNFLPLGIWTGQIVATVIPIAIRHGGSTSSE